MRFPFLNYICLKLHKIRDICQRKQEHFGERELISSDILLIEKKFLEKALAEDYAQLQNGRNQIARELNRGHTSNPHGLADEVNRTIPDRIRFKQEAIRKINETLKKQN